MPKRDQPMNIFGETSNDVIVRLRRDNAALIAALKWFSDPDNWREEQLSNGAYFTAEWRLGFDPREIARVALSKAGVQS